MSTAQVHVRVFIGSHGGRVRWCDAQCQHVEQAPPTPGAECETVEDWLRLVLQDAHKGTAPALKVNP